MTLTMLPPVFVALVLLGDAGSVGVRLAPETVAGWTHYVSTVEARRLAELKQPGRFLVMDTDPTRVADRRALSSSELIVRGMTATEDGGTIEVPSGLVHHWRGAVLLPNVSLAQLLARLESAAPPTSPEILRSSILLRGPEVTKVYLRLQRTKIITVVYDTEHDVRFSRHDATRAASTSVATRIVEIENPGTPGERLLPAGDDHGFLWRLNAYWRYQEVAGGVIAECESISLSRSLPFGLGAVAGPIVRSTARESMERTLESLRGMAAEIR